MLRTNESEGSSVPHPRQKLSSLPHELLHRVVAKLGNTGDVMNLARSCRELHKAVDQYPWSRADYPGWLVHAAAPGCQLPPAAQARGWLALIRERRAYAYVPPRHGLGPDPTWECSFLELSAAGRVGRALAVLPDCSQRPQRKYWPAIEALLLESGQPLAAHTLAQQRLGFDRLTLAVASGDGGLVSQLLPQLFLAAKEDCGELARAYLQSRSPARERGLQTLMRELQTGHRYGREWAHELATSVLLVNGAASEGSDVALPSKESLRCLWHGLSRVSFAMLEQIWGMGPERCRFALHTDRPYAAPLRSLCTLTLTYPHCQRLSYILDESLWPAYEDETSRERSLERKAAVLEMLGRSELLEAASEAPARQAVRNILYNFMEARNVRAKHTAISSLRSMLALWERAAGAAKISQLMSEALEQDQLFGPSLRCMDFALVGAFAGAGGRIYLHQLIRWVERFHDRASCPPAARGKASEWAAARQRLVLEILEGMAAQGALASFTPADEKSLRSIFPGVQYGRGLCLRARQLAEDPQRPVV